MALHSAVGPLGTLGNGLLVMLGWGNPRMLGCSD